MDFPLGSLAVLVYFVLIGSGLIRFETAKYRVMVLGLAGVLAGSFLMVPLPAPKGVQVLLNAGHSLIPLLMAAVLWLQAPAEDRYRASLVTLAICVLIYCLAALLDLEPGLLPYPLFFSVPMAAVIALLLGRTVYGAGLGIVGGCILVVLIRYFETTFTLQVKAFLELPGDLIWNTMSLSVLSASASIQAIEHVKSLWGKRWQTKQASLGAAAASPRDQNGTEQSEELMPSE